MGRNKNFREEDVLDKAIQLFKLKGFRGTSPEELVKFMGISRSSLYLTFGDKYSLLISALKRYRELTRDALQKIMETATDPYQGLLQIFELSMEGCYSDESPNGCFLVNSVIEFGPEDSEATAIIKDSFEDSRKALFYFVEKGMETGEISTSTSPEIITDYLLNTISGIVVSSKAGMDVKACQNIIKKALESVL